jgi:RND family efflux transporter MFP subunit
MSTLEPTVPAPEHRRLLRILVVVGLVLLTLYVVGLVPRLLLQHRLAEEADAARTRLPMVSTAQPVRAPQVVDVPLPGSMEPILTTGIFARTDGYLLARYVDIGDRVTKGQLLADIDTPEVDQQLRQARAQLAQDKANVAKFQADLGLARTTLARFVAAGPGTVSKQQIDERASAVTDAERTVDAGVATVAADDANVQRLLDLQAFQKVYAPFDGVITVRNVDPGSLISAGSSTAVTELFTLAQVDVLRIFVFVPQSYSPDVSAGQTAEVTVRERPGQVFMGKVTRTAGAIDPASRTMLTEVQVPNPDGLLLSGSYATVKFSLQRAKPPLTIPSSALLVDASGVRVAIVEPDGTLRYTRVEIGRDYGTRVEVLSGLQESDVLATNLTPGIGDGAKVDVAKPSNEVKPGAPGTAANPGGPPAVGTGAGAPQDAR